MPKLTGKEGQKNFTGKNLKELRKTTGDSQRSLAIKLQCLGLDVDKNVIGQ